MTIRIWAIEGKLKREVTDGGCELHDDYRAMAVANGIDPDDLEEYRAAMVAERRLVYVLTPERVYPSPR